MVYLLFFLIPIVLLLAWVSWSTGSGVGLETWVMTSMWRHRLHGGTRNADDGMGCRTLPVPTEVKGAAAKTAYHDGVPEGRRPKSERGKAIAAKVKVES